MDLFRWLVNGLLCSSLLSCGGGGGGGQSTPSQSSTAASSASSLVTSSASSTGVQIGGTVSGLLGSLVLQNNFGDDLSLNSPGSFHFATYITKGSNYLVTIKNQPVGEFCQASNQSGQASDTISDITVTCSSPHMAPFVGNTGGEGFQDAKGDQARLYFPENITLDPQGNILITESQLGTLRKVTPRGDVSTFLGKSFSRTFVDGPLANAQLNSPVAMTYNSKGNLFFIDGSTIRMLTLAGQVTTFAGSDTNSRGNIDGQGTAASFSYPTSIAVDDADNLYVTDRGNNNIRKITPAGLVSTLAGLATSTGAYADGNGTAARFNYPHAIAVDSHGNLYVADMYNYVIRKITPTGDVTTVAGQVGVKGSADGSALQATLSRIFDLTVDPAGNLWMADTDNYTIRKLSTTGQVTTFVGKAGVRDYADGDKALFVGPQALRMDNSGNLIVLDLNEATSDHRAATLRKITPSGFVTTLAGTASVYGGLDGIGSQAQFAHPWGMAKDPSGNSFFVAEAAGSRIRKVTTSGTVSLLAGSGNPGSKDGTGANAQFNGPESVAVDVNGNIYVADSGNDIIRKITPAGVVTTLAGSAGASGTVDGAGSTARFNTPFGITVDSSGNLYVADSHNCAIRKITQSGVVSTLAGTAGTCYNNDATKLGLVYDIVIDSAGNLIVSDVTQNTLHKITPSGVVSKLAGVTGTSGSNDGPGDQATFKSPSALAIDSSDNVYVSDNISLIRKVAPSGAVTTVAGQLNIWGFVPGDLPGALLPNARLLVIGNSLYVTQLNGIVRISPLP